MPLWHLKASAGTVGHLDDKVPRSFRLRREANTPVAGPKRWSMTRSRKGYVLLALRRESCSKFGVDVTEASK